MPGPGGPSLHTRSTRTSQMGNLHAHSAVADVHQAALTAAMRQHNELNVSFQFARGMIHHVYSCSVRVVHKVVDSVINGADSLSIIIRDLNVEFVLKGQDKLDGLAGRET